MKRKLSLFIATFVAAGTIAAPMVAGAEGGGSSPKDNSVPENIDARWTCDGVTITSTKGISNVIIVTERGTTKIEDAFNGQEVYEYTFDAAAHPGLVGVKVKSGNNGTRGAGQAITLVAPDCDSDPSVDDEPDPWVGDDRDT